MTKTPQPSLPWRKYGIVLGAFLVVYGLLFRLFGWPSSSPLTWLFYLAQPAILVWLTRSESARTRLTRMRRFGASMAAAIVGNGIYTVYVYLFNHFIDDSLVRNGLAAALDKLQASGLSTAEIAAKSALVERFYTHLNFSLSIFSGLTIVALLSALLLLSWPVASARSPGG